MNTKLALVWDPERAGREIDAVWERREAVERKRADYDDTLLKLLLDAKANYGGPFKQFVETYTHISLTTAKRTLRIADGRGEDVRQAERARQKKSRAAKGVTVTPPTENGDLQSYLDVLAEYEQLGRRLAALVKDHPLSIADARKFIEASDRLIEADTGYDVWNRPHIDISDRIRKADEIDGLTKEAKAAAKDPERFLQKARESEQDTYMADDRDEAKQAAKDSGESWSDQKESWEADWISDNWDEHREAEFKRDFLEQWECAHGKPFPNSKYGA
jgi:hypothetical protein